MHFNVILYCFLYDSNKFSDLSSHSINIPDIGVFPTSYHAYQAYKDIDNQEYVDLLKQGIYKRELINITDNWNEKKMIHMYNILKLKFNQHQELKEELLNTNLKKLNKISDDNYWGIGEDSKGKNRYSLILENLREYFLITEN